MSTPTVGLVGSGPPRDAVRDALEDVRAEAVVCNPDRIGAMDLAVVVAETGSESFARAHRTASESDTPWLAVELGGVGGHEFSDVDAAISGFAPQTACYDCLRTRVGAIRDAGEGEDDDSATASRSIPDHAQTRFAGALAGREVVALLSGAESPVLGGVLEVPRAERSVLPVPGCDSCGADADRYADANGDPRLDRAHVETELEDAVARAEQAVDERVGVVSSVGEAESVPAPYYLSNIADTSRFSDVQAAEQAAGVSADWNAALMKSLGEALERYAAGVYHEADFETARANDLDSAVSPEAFVRPDDWADPSDDSIAWVTGEHLQTRESVALPMEFVHFPPPKERYKPSITTGLGLGSSTVEALLSGCYEVIERDATMLAWYSTFEPLGLAVESEEFDALRQRARAEGLSVTPLLVTQDVDVPVVAVAVHRESGWPKFAVGSDADLDPDSAATAALAEALQNWMELRSMGDDDAREADGAIGRYADFPDRARAFVTPETTIPSASVGPAELRTGEAELDAVVDRLADADCPAYAVRLTTRDLEQLGFEAVRVLVPSAQPLFTGESFFGERAREVPESLGFEFRPDRPHHPYP